MPLRMKDIGAHHWFFSADGINFKATTGWVTHQFFVPRDLLEHLSGHKGNHALDLRTVFDEFADRIAQAAEKATRTAGNDGPANPGAYIMLKPEDFD